MLRLFKVLKVIKGIIPKSTVDFGCGRAALPHSRLDGFGRHLAEPSGTLRNPTEPFYPPRGGIGQAGATPSRTVAHCCVLLRTIANHFRGKKFAETSITMREFIGKSVFHLCKSVA